MTTTIELALSIVSLGLCCGAVLNPLQPRAIYALGIAGIITALLFIF